MYRKIKNLQTLLNTYQQIDEAVFSNFLSDLYNESIDKSTLEKHVLYFLFLSLLFNYYKLYGTLPSFYNKTIEEFYDDVFLSLKTFIDDVLGNITDEDMELLALHLQNISLVFGVLVSTMIKSILFSFPKVLRYAYVNMLFSSLSSYVVFLQGWKDKGYNVEDVLFFDLPHILQAVSLSNFSSDVHDNLITLCTIIGNQDLADYITKFKHISVEDFYTLQEAYKHLDIIRLVKLFSTYSGLHLGYESYFTDEFKNKVLSVAETLGVKDEVVKNYPQYFNN